jgi:hypothetical protein
MDDCQPLEFEGPPLILSLSKESGGSWFDGLTMSGLERALPYTPA